MKRETLEGLGIDKVLIEKIMAEYGKDEAAVVEAKEQLKQLKQLEADRDSLKQQLADVGDKLKAFDGVDIEALNGEIGKLKDELSAKETEFNAQLSERDFIAMLNTEILGAKGKNPKAVMALLDLDRLKASKNQKDDALTAIKALQESDAYLFDDVGTDNTATTPAKMSSGGAHEEGGGDIPSSTNAWMNGLIKGELKGD